MCECTRAYVCMHVFSVIVKCVYGVISTCIYKCNRSHDNDIAYDRPQTDCSNRLGLLPRVSVSSGILAYCGKICVHTRQAYVFLLS